MELYKDIIINSFDELKDIMKSENIVTSSVCIGRFNDEGRYLAEYKVPRKFSIVKQSINEYDKHFNHTKWKVRLTHLIYGYDMNMIAY